jgi:hypothetical protein
MLTRKTAACKGTIVINTETTNGSTWGLGHAFVDVDTSKAVSRVTCGDNDNREKGLATFFNIVHTKLALAELQTTMASVLSKEITGSVP